MKYFKWIYLIPGIIFAGIGEVDKLWSFATISAALCALPNLVAVLALSGVFWELQKDYMRGQNQYATKVIDATQNYLKGDITWNKVKQIWPWIRSRFS